MKSNTSKPKTTAVILSGGAGTRFGGLDKGLEKYQGRPLIEHVIERVSQQAEDIILCVNPNHQQYQEYGYTIISDQQRDNNDYQGPMAGIRSVLQTFEDKQIAFLNHHLLISSCDTPNIPFDYARKLYSSMLSNNASSAVVFDGQRKQNLHCLIDSSAWQSLQAFYDEGGRAMHRWHKKNGSIEVDFSDQTASFSNINSPELLEQP